MKMRTIKMFTCRIIMVIILAVLTSVIPDFIAFLNIVGSIGSTILAFVLPCVYYM